MRFDMRPQSWTRTNLGVHINIREVCFCVASNYPRCVLCMLSAKSASRSAADLQTQRRFAKQLRAAFIGLRAADIERGGLGLYLVPLIIDHGEQVVIQGNDHPLLFPCLQRHASEAGEPRVSGRVLGVGLDIDLDDLLGVNASLIADRA